MDSTNYFYSIWKNPDFLKKEAEREIDVIIKFTNKSPKIPKG
jgi:hypothetical protein